MQKHDITGWRDWLADGETALATGDVERSIALLGAVRDVLRAQAGEAALAELPPEERDDLVRLALRLLRAWRVAVRHAVLRN